MIKLKKGIFLGPQGKSVFLEALGELQNAELPIIEAQAIYVLAKALNDHIAPVQEHCKALTERYGIGTQLAQDASDADVDDYAARMAAHQADIKELVDIEFKLEQDPVELPFSQWALDPELKKLRIKSSVLGVLQEAGVVVIT